MYSIDSFLYIHKNIWKYCVNLIVTLADDNAGYAVLIT